MFWCLCYLDSHLQLSIDLTTYRQEKIQNRKSLESFCCDQGQKERHTSLKISVVSHLYQKFLLTKDVISKKDSCAWPQVY